MVSKVEVGRSSRDAVFDLEQQAKVGKKELIHSANYGKGASELTYKDKAETLEKQSALNERATLNTVRMNVDFPGDRLSGDQLRDISDRLMRKMGYKDQPYLVYQRQDVAHPSIQILTTPIRPDGSRIDIHRMGQRMEAAGRDLEKEFKLAPGHEQRLRQTLDHKQTEHLRPQHKRQRHRIE